MSNAKRSIAHDIQTWDYSDRTKTHVQHEYSKRHLIWADPVMYALLGQVCSPETHQPDFNRKIRILYRWLLQHALAYIDPFDHGQVHTRMDAVLSPNERADGRGTLFGPVFCKALKFAVWNLARAGEIPTLVVADMLYECYNSDNIRRDHITIARQTDPEGKVTGARIFNGKVHPLVDGLVIIIPDPMGATGSSMCQALAFLKNECEGTPRQVVAMNLIVTPQYLQHMEREHPDVYIHALRLDRGMSPPEVFDHMPGVLRSQEKGLNDHDYIVPGGGGFGELMNNCYV